MFEGTGNLGNNVLPLIPEIQEIFDHPLVHGAMQGVLGENYAMHSHCDSPMKRCGISSSTDTSR
jgi:hypothetical protein